MFPETFELPVPEERNATCDRCAMCAPAQTSFLADEYFNPKTKCCTYHPVLPNYAVGGLLADESAEGAEGRRRIRDKIAQRIGVTPLALLPSAKDRLLYRHGMAGFGRAHALLCPFLEQERGACTVWKFREAACATWFCKHERGQDALSFWHELRDYLLLTQGLLSAFALRSLGWDVDRIPRVTGRVSDLDARDLDEMAPDSAAYAATWGEWAMREEELYRSAYEVVRALDRDAFAALGGFRHRLELERLEKRHRDMTKPKLPDPLLRNPGLCVRRDADDSYILMGYSGTDPLRLRKAVYDLLDFFDGRRSTANARAVIQTQAGVWMSDALLTKLYQHRILVDARAPSTRHLPIAQP